MKRLALTVVAFFVAIAPTMAIEVTLLPATQFSRAPGKPVILTESFVASEGFALLQLTNGAGGGEMAVRSASIAVNGIEVDFDPRFETITEEIAVAEGLNELTVDLRGVPGSLVTISISQDREPCPEGVVQCQMVTPHPRTQSAAPDSPVSILVEYSSDDAEVTGLGLSVHYDSSQLIFDEATNVFPTSFVGMLDTDDLADLDGDPDTNRRVLIAWSSPLTSDWPGTNFQILMTVHFNTASTFSGSTQINFSAQQPPFFVFVSTPATVVASP